ncbi:mandelate racemase/muconate lactonizing enzyme family protein [Jiangella alba]|uniref:Galactonate dehydratase n=1 Tax=Jiangella alba TaxID=561176 RepID=A0A1H5PYG3_9ACTN|nr:mandelate racemase/muconate lactonizing enzyme family protein [Jiangella alba]SEF18231.1 galactonate dehydratase [Jiangella alba]
MDNELGLPMRITEVEPLVIATGTGTYLLVVVHTDAGLHGLGEVGMRSRPRAVLGALADFAALAVGTEAHRIEELSQLFLRGGFFPAVGDVAAAAAGIDLALWDLRGKALGVPVHELLGGAVREHVPAYVHVQGRGLAEYLDHAHELAGQGWRHLRIGLQPPAEPVLEPRATLRENIAVFHGLRDALGDDVELLVDVHTRLDPAEAAVFCREIEPARPFFVEDPLRAENLDAYRTLRARTAVPLAAGEQLTTLWEFRPLLEGDLVDHARIDLANTGLTQGRKIAALAEAHHIQIATHNPLGPVCTAASAHFNVTLPNVSVQEQGHPHGWADDPLVPAGPLVSAGAVRPGDGPGFGVEVDLAAARRAAAGELGPPPRYRRPDGSLTNW